jgi:transposase
VRLVKVSRLLRPNYAQRFLLPPALDEWVSLAHPVRFVRDFVDSLDLSTVGIHEPVTEEGRPAFAPDLLLKVWLFGYMERIRSTRALEKACVQVMPFLWLTGRLQPDHNTLWRFFKLHREALPKIFKMLVKMAAEAKLVGFVLHALDGTKMTAAGSTDEALHRKGIEERLKHLDEFIDAYMKVVSTRSEGDRGKEYGMPLEMVDGDARRARLRALLNRRIEDREDGMLLDGNATSAEQPPPPEKVTQEEAAPQPAATTSDRDDEPPTSGGPSLPAPSAPSPEPPSDPLLREANRLREELAAGIEKLDQAGVNHLNEAEPDARMMKIRGGTHALGYNAQIVVDHDSDMIVACEVVTDQNDLGQLVPMLEEVKAVLGRVADESIGDNGYASGLQFKSAEENAMPVLVSLREEPEGTGEYAKTNFRYDEESNVYVCPQGERLVQIGKNKSYPEAKEPDAIYRCKNKTCPVRAQCTKDPLGRKVRRPYGDDARARQAQKQQDPRMRALLSLRKEIVEHLFGIVKTIDGFRRFTVRGRPKVRAQWSLVCLAVDLRKLHAMATWKDGKLVPRAHALLAATSKAG